MNLNNAPTLARRRPPTPVLRSEPEAPSLERARTALSQARLVRAEYLVALAEGLIDVSDVLEFAATEAGKPLRRISLRQLLLSQPGWGDRRTKHALSLLTDRLGAPINMKEMTIAWLLDPRAGGRRYMAWLDVRQPKDEAPWPGFPFTAGEGVQ